MRSTGYVATAVLILAGASRLASQTNQTEARDRMTYDVGAGMSRYGPHAFGGLELAMKRWLAVRGEGLFSLHSRDTRPNHRLTAFALSGVLSYGADRRVSPYLLGGYAFSVGQGSGSAFGPLGAAGIRFRFGKVQPFMEFRAQHSIGAPISIGVRF